MAGRRLPGRGEQGRRAGAILVFAPDANSAKPAGLEADQDDLRRRGGVGRLACEGAECRQHPGQDHLVGEPDAEAGDQHEAEAKSA